LLTKMSTSPSLALVSAKAASTADLSTMSATRVKTLMLGKLNLSDVAVLWRVESVRPRRAIDVLPAVAKAWAMWGPRPDPPPVIRTTFPATESSGREGETLG
jgi:hypothetical protein